MEEHHFPSGLHLSVTPYFCQPLRFSAAHIA